MSRYTTFFLSILITTLFFFHTPAAATKLPDLTPKTTKEKADEIMKEHATHKQLTPELVKRVLQNYLEQLDPTKTYFIESDIDKWLNPSDAELQQILKDYNNANFKTFDDIHQVMANVVSRHDRLGKQIDINALPKHVKADEFKDMKWVQNEQELLTRLTRIRALQMESASKLNEETKEKTLQRIAKRQDKYEEEITTTDPTQRERLVLSNTLKGIAAALDSHTVYFTPDEASQFMINVQQRLFGIGAQLRDDLNGFTIVKLVDGGPAALSKELKAKDRIIAVNGEPVVGMDIIDAVDLIRGEENTPVVLTIVRENNDGEEKKEETLEVTLKRAAVVLKESRYESSYEPFGNGAIGYVRLYSFYQDEDSSSGTDIESAINELKKEHNLNGLVLDLRYNSGGILSQAVAIAGLFITKGVVVSIKDEVGNIQHLRDLDGKTTWDGPLIVLINRASASASEIVAQTLQDYGRAIIVGDDHSFGKGSFQTFTLNASGKKEDVNPGGEFKVTRGRYYTVSGKTPQLTGVLANIVVPGPLSEAEVGEKYNKYPLDSDSISPNFDDDLSDIPFFQRERVRLLYKFNLQPLLHTYEPYMAQLKKNSHERIENNKEYQQMLKSLKKEDVLDEDEPEENTELSDFQLQETYNIMRDLIYLELEASKANSIH